jgi:para-nitrobenzyl esterase
LARKGVIVVTLNYRLGALGLLAHPELTKEGGTSGNYSLLDVIAALKWVHENITALGGDTNNVTIFSQSAGAYQASMLMVSPAARGLFRRVIASSGGELGTQARYDAFPMLAQAEQSGVAYLKKLNVSNIEGARRVPAEAIVAADNEIDRQNEIDSKHLKNRFSTLDMNIDGHLISAPVRTLYARNKQAPVDLLVGSNSDEGVNPGSFGPPEPADAYKTDLQARYGDFGRRFLEIYPADSDTQAAESQVRLGSDEKSWRAFTWAQFQSSRGVHHVYLYRFSSVPPFAPWGKLRAAGHGAELPYVFGFPPMELLQKFETPDQAALHRKIEDQIQSYWTNFAKTGDPNGPDLPQWPIFTEREGAILNMADEFMAGKMPNKPALALMDAYHGS